MNNYNPLQQYHRYRTISSSYLKSVRTKLLMLSHTDNRYAVRCRLSTISIFCGLKIVVAGSADTGLELYHYARKPYLMTSFILQFFPLYCPHATEKYKGGRGLQLPGLKVPGFLIRQLRDYIRMPFLPITHRWEPCELAEAPCSRTTNRRCPETIPNIAILEKYTGPYNSTFVEGHSGNRCVGF